MVYSSMEKKEIKSETYSTPTAKIALSPHFLPLPTASFQMRQIGNPSISKSTRALKLDVAVSMAMPLKHVPGMWWAIIFARGTQRKTVKKKIVVKKTTLDQMRDW